MRPFVVYWNNIPAPYMVDRFNALTDVDAVDFEAWFSDRHHLDRSWSVDESTWRFKYRYLPVSHLFGRTIHWPLPLLGRRPDFIVSLYAEPSFIVGWALARLRGIRTGFRVLMTHDRWVKRNSAKEAVKRFLFQRVDAIETPGEDGKRYAIRYGANTERIFIATHTVDIPLLSGAAREARAHRDALRDKLSLIGTTFIFVGRLWWGKGVEYLLEAFKAVQQSSTEPVSLLVMGDGPDEAKLRRVCRDLEIRNVTFGGFKQHAELARYYAASDILVFPTLGDPYGLVVDEAMACGLPVISTTAAGEIRGRVEDGVNGYIVPPEDSASLAQRMLRLAQDLDLRARMGRASEQKVCRHTPKEWAHDFLTMVDSVLARGRRP